MNTKPCLVIALVASILAPVSAIREASAQGVNLSGKWTFTVETPTGTGKSTFTLKQTGQKISGTYEGRYGKAPVVGTVKGNAVRMSINVPVDGKPLEITYDGTFVKDTLKGIIRISHSCAFSISEMAECSAQNPTPHSVSTQIPV
jgi:hypothetical protein